MTVTNASKCLARELLDCLRSVGFSKKEIIRGQRQIEETGLTVFESSNLTDSNLEDVLKRREERY